jgi:hypothetical protein
MSTVAVEPASSTTQQPGIASQQQQHREWLWVWQQAEAGGLQQHGCQ